MSYVSTPQGDARGTFQPMEIEYDIEYEQFEKCKIRVEQTLFPKKEFKTEKARHTYALLWHNHLECSTLEELVERIAYIHLRELYCHWCRNYDTDNMIVEHEHIMGNAGRYRGVLCKRCNVLEGIIKHKSYEEKIDHLYNKIGDRVYYDHQWIVSCVDRWYHSSL